MGPLVGGLAFAACTNAEDEVRTVRNATKPRGDAGVIDAAPPPATPDAAAASATPDAATPDTSADLASPDAHAGAPLDARAAQPEDAAAADAGADAVAACPSGGHHPWNGDGVTATFNEPGNARLFVVSRDKYWTHEWQRGWTGRLGWLADLWKTLGPVGGRRPWQGPGVTGLFRLPGSNTVTVISVDRYWTFDWATGTTKQTGMLSDLWRDAPANQGELPWRGAGVTAVSPDPAETTLAVISKERYWTYDLMKGAFTNQVGRLETAWKTAPAIGGRLPWHEPGVGGGFTASPTRTTVLGRDRFWQFDHEKGAFLPETGLLRDAWDQAPALPCP